jgi:hypothetical protein
LSVSYSHTCFVSGAVRSSQTLTLQSHLGEFLEITFKDRHIHSASTFNRNSGLEINHILLNLSVYFLTVFTALQRCTCVHFPAGSLLAPVHHKLNCCPLSVSKFTSFLKVSRMTKGPMHLHGSGSHDVSTVVICNFPKFSQALTQLRFCATVASPSHIITPQGFKHIHAC